MKQKNLRKWNYKVFLVSNSLGYFAGGLIGPFYVLFLQEIGGTIENFGIAVGILLLAESLTSYFVGKYSDKLGRKPFLIASGFFSSLILFLYTLVSSLYQLFILQIANGINEAVWKTTETTFLGDITKKVSRGAQIGKYRAIIGVFTGLAIIIGGKIVGKFGFSLMFYATVLIIALSTSILFLIKE